MNILVIGSGGREHAVIKAIKKNPTVETIYCLPGNGGIAADAVCVNIGAKDIDGIVKFAAENKIDYAVVTPDDPLVLGCVDALTAIGIHATQHQGIVGGDHGVVDGVLRGELDDTLDILRADVLAGRVGGDTAVTGEAVDGLHGGVLFNGFDDGMLTSAAANDQQIHI